jgi:hypothetical protein
MYRLLRRILSSSEFEAFDPLGTLSFTIFRPRNEFAATSEIDECDSPRDDARDLGLRGLARLAVAGEEWWRGEEVL